MELKDPSQLSIMRNPFMWPERHGKRKIIYYTLLCARIRKGDDKRWRQMQRLKEEKEKGRSERD